MDSCDKQSQRTYSGGNDLNNISSQTVDKVGAGALAPAPLFLPKCQLPYFFIKDKKES